MSHDEELNGRHTIWVVRRVQQLADKSGCLGLIYWELYRHIEINTSATSKKAPAPEEANGPLFCTDLLEQRGVDPVGLAFAHPNLRHGNYFFTV
jgi:hypothetical protein